MIKEWKYPADVKVYFETDDIPLRRSAEMVARFNSEEVYDLCFPALKKFAKKHGLIVTESVDEFNYLTKKIKN